MSIKHIAVFVDDSSASLVAAKYAVYLARILGAKLTALYAFNEKILQDLLKSHIFVEIEARVYEHDLQEQGRLFLERIKKMAESKQVDFEGIFLRGVVHLEVVNKVNQIGADFLVMGELKEVFSRKEIYTDEDERILREAGCPVVVAKNPAQIEQLYKELV